MSASTEALPRGEPPPFAIVPVTAEMHEPIFRLHEELFRPHIEKIWGWNEEWQIQNFTKNWETCETQAIQSDGAIIGFLQVLRFPDHIFLKNLGLHEAWQGRRIGAGLIEDLQGQAAERGVPIRLSVFVTNPRAREFYLAGGFRDTNHDAQFQHMVWQPK